MLEEQESFGGTWITHKYPGIRSDSDLYTFGYRFKPWTGKPIAKASEILDYMGEVIAENDLASPYPLSPSHRLGLLVQHGKTLDIWTSPIWRRARPCASPPISCGCARAITGTRRATRREWPDMANFKGRIVHPQRWPDDLDYKGKKMIVIGSGATAATLIPSVCQDVEHVTMLQRSPTYFIPARNANTLADELRQLQVDETWIHEIVRRRILFDQANFARRSFEEPEKVREELMGAVRLFLGNDYDIDKHFNPTYRPWRQRIAFVPDGDLFRGIRSGKASVVTDEIERFTEKGILLKSGQELEADIIVTATGFDLNVLGDIEFEIDGRKLDFADTVTYRGMMFTGVPNMVWVFGYFRASWTLRADLVSDFVCRLLVHMKDKQAKKVEVALRPEDKDMKLLPWIDTENFNPGYVLRGMHLLPKRGEKPEWQHTQDYWDEKDIFPKIDLDDKAFVYG